MSEINIEVVFALPDRQSLLSIAVDAGATVAQVVRHQEVEKAFPDSGFDELSVGIWGHEVDRDRVLKDGDRVEIYRPLELDPKEARRRLALTGRTMSSGESD
jgi:putative ubiquitin-RnfH superfamily antitoxin RatB of RatAB toxin-antitoxin module